MKKRLFIAINFDTATKLAVAKLIAAFPNTVALNKTKLDNLHLTVQFLGDVEEESISDIQTILTSVAEQFASTELNFTQLGAFPNWQTPNIIWLGLAPNLILAKLYQQLTPQLLKLVPTMDTKSFRPHLTLARIKSALSATELKLIQSAHLPFISVPVTQINLMTSTLTSVGPVYQLISRHPLIKY